MKALKFYIKLYDGRHIKCDRSKVLMSKLPTLGEVTERVDKWRRVKSREERRPFAICLNEKDSKIVESDFKGLGMKNSLDNSRTGIPINIYADAEISYLCEYHPIVQLELY